MKAGKLSSEEKSNIESQKVLQKYTYYYKRYKSCWDGVALTRKLGERLERHLKHADLSKYAFVFDAIEKLMLARRVLQWTYALAYYFRADRAKSLFEYQQEMLLNATESLQDLLERHDARDTDGLFSMRKDIINKTASIDKFRMEMVNQVERGEFEDLLLAEADTSLDRWTCVCCKTDNQLKSMVRIAHMRALPFEARELLFCCQSAHFSAAAFCLCLVQHCSNPACGACKLHGEPDCKSTSCKQQPK